MYVKIKCQLNVFVVICSPPQNQTNKSTNKHTQQTTEQKQIITERQTPPPKIHALFLYTNTEQVDFT